MHLDLNECETLNGGCQQECINTNGSFHCQCHVGLFLNGNGRTCAGKLVPYIINDFLEGGVNVSNGSQKYVTNLARNVSTLDFSVLFKCCIYSYKSSHRRYSIKKAFLKISQNSQENTCATVPFIRK